MANENKLLRENGFKIVGKLVNAEVTIGTRKDGGQFVSTKAIVHSNIAGVLNEFEVSFYSNEKTVDGADNKLFATYSKLPELLNKKIEINGYISESRFWSTKNEQMASAQVLNGKWVKGVVETSADEATYTLGGFVAKEVVDKTNKAGEVYRHDLVIAQSNYGGDNLSMFTVHVKPEDREILQGVKSYQAGNTVKIQGDLSFIVEEKVIEEQVGFGKPVLRKFTNITRGFYITGGSNPISDESSYDQVMIRTLIEAYKAADVERMNNAQNNSTAKTAVVNKPAQVTQRQTSLI
jgi:hypothetical protein